MQKKGLTSAPWLRDRGRHRVSGPLGLLGVPWLVSYLTVVVLRESFSANVPATLSSYAAKVMNKGFKDSQFNSDRTGKVAVLHGKLLLIDNYKVSDIQGHLPECLAASGSDDVGTIGIITSQSTATGRVQVNSATGYRMAEYFNFQWVSLYDAATSEQLGTVVIRQYLSYGTPWGFDANGIVDAAKKKWH